jgi:pantetheine-phosphate adenylyltransferase
MTAGHMDIIKRSLRIVDNLVIAVANNINKDSLFSVQERINIIKSDINSVNELNSKINVTELSGLLTTFAKDQNATCIIRGLRAVSDFEYEFQMTGMNYQLNPEIETIFLMTSEKNSFISSNFVKEVHKLGGDVSNFVSKNTLEQLNKKNS